MKNVLVIEDNQQIRENIQEILKLANFNVLIAENGKVGIETAIINVPDIIICDIMMPELDGYAVYHMLKKNTLTENIPFIFLSAKAEHNEVRKGMDLGADDYITKPFSGTELLNSIEMRLKRAEQFKKLTSGINGLDELVSILSGEEALKQFVDNRGINKYKRKQVIYAEGNRPQYLHFIQKGKVKTYRINDDGKELVIKLYNEGEFLGYTALIEKCNYKEFAEALDDCEISSIPITEFEILLNSNTEVQIKFMQILANNVLELEQQLLGLAYNSLRKKVADTLLTIQQKYFQKSENPMEIKMSRETMANTLSDFKDEKLIKIQLGIIILLNERNLKAMLN
ncbi:MAG: hypothetical protein NVSMB45_06200 [Ginsengibacter sp.]